MLFAPVLLIHALYLKTHKADWELWGTEQKLSIPS